MTSGNVSDEPIAHEDDDALERLAGIADLVTPPRPPDPDAHRRLGAARGPRRRPLLLRRSRGFVPDSLPLPVATARPLLACGAELKSTFCVAKGTRAWVGHHIGDLKSYEVLQAYEAGIEHFERLFAVVPEVVAHDEHPDYLSTRYALAREGVETVAVQHHHAHLAACLAEHGETGPRGRRDLRRQRATARDGTRVGRRDARRRPARLRARRAPVAGAPPGRRPRGRASRGGWRSRGCSRPAGTVRSRARARRSAGARSRARAHRPLLAADDEHGAAVRRGRRAVRAARRGDLRGSGGDRARGGCADPARAGRVRAGAGGARRPADDPRGRSPTSTPGVDPAVDLRPLPQRGRRAATRGGARTRGG